MCECVLWGIGDGLLIKGAFGAFYLFLINLLKFQLLLNVRSVCVFVRLGIEGVRIGARN